MFVARAKYRSKIVKCKRDSVMWTLRTLRCCMFFTVIWPNNDVLSKSVRVQPLVDVTSPTYCWLLVSVVEECCSSCHVAVLDLQYPGSVRCQ